MKPKNDKIIKSSEEKKIKIPKKTYVITGGLVFLGAIITILIVFFYPSEETLASVKGIEDTTYENRQIEQVDLNTIIDQNIQKPIREEINTEEIDLEYTTIYQESSELPKGKIQVIQEGRDGRQTVINRKTYEGDTLVKEEYSANIVTKAAINKIVEVGTSTSIKNSKIKKGDILYVTSYTLNIMLEPSKNSEKVTTLNKEDSVTLLEIKNDWYKVQTGIYVGWADSQCFTNKTQVVESETQVQEKGSSKQALTAKLSKNMALNKPSGLTLDQFKKVLSGNSQDKNKIFEENAEYFYYIEKQYNINGVFVAAVGIHESGWGTSKIALNKKNLFGYGASDNDPYGNAYKFSSYSEGIDLIARVFTKYYINPAGTKIYDGQTASGKYYQSSTLDSINKRYATDKNWSNSVYKWMEYLYNKI